MNSKDYERYEEIIEKRDLWTNADDTFDVVALKKLGLYSKEDAQLGRISRQMGYIERLSSEDRALFLRITSERTAISKERYKEICKEYNSIKIDTSDPGVGQNKRRQYLESLSLEDQELFDRFEQYAKYDAKMKEDEAKEKAVPEKERQELADARREAKDYKLFFQMAVGAIVLIILSAIFQ